MNYTIMHELGKGATSNVFLAADNKTSEQIALKVSNSATGARATEYALKEASVLKALNHPNIIKLVSSEIQMDDQKTECPSSVTLALEYALNGELFHYVVSSGVLQEKIVRHFFRQLVDGLEHIHSQGYAHRDIKLENLLLDASFNLKIADFGFSYELKGGLKRGIVGTKPYMAPEMLQGDLCDYVKCDIFSIGVTLFALVAGSFPFSAARKDDDSFGLIIAQKWDEFWKAKEVMDSTGKPRRFSGDFKNLFQKMMSYNPEKRITIAEIKEHEWFKKAPLSSNIVRAQFTVIKRELLMKKKPLMLAETSLGKSEKTTAETSITVC